MGRGSGESSGASEAWSEDRAAAGLRSAGGGRHPIRSRIRGHRLARTVVGGSAPLTRVLEVSCSVFSGLGPWWFGLGLRLADCLLGSGFAGGARGGGCRRGSLQGSRLVDSLAVLVAGGG
ncbi:hypothetical protein ZWY2020_034412 [Hordeum vulgare]|nr:hypothetical protein ZWY2020_034412 [Hordeum vulgare]